MIRIYRCTFFLAMGFVLVPKYRGLRFEEYMRYTTLVQISLAYKSYIIL